MKVLIIHDYGTLHGGAEHVSDALRHGLRKRGHEAIFLASDAQRLDIDNVADITCRGSTGFSRRLLQVANPSARLAVNRALSNFKPDVVHLRMFMTQLSPLILPALRHVPTILHVVNYDLICPLNIKRLPDGAACHDRAGAACKRNGCLPWIGVARGMVQQRMTHHWLNCVDRIVCNSHWVRKRLEDEGVPVTDVVWNGVPQAKARMEMSDEPLIACASRLFAKKGVDVLINAMELLRHRMPKVKLLIAGDGPERAALKNLTIKKNLHQNITFLGHLPRERMEEAFAPIWAQVVPSTWEEPFGLVAAEAHMRGKAAVISDIGGLTEIIDQGVTGMTFRTGDANDLAERLHEFLSDRNRALEMGKAGRRRALAHFTEDRMINQFVDMYHQLLQPAEALA